MAFLRIAGSMSAGPEREVALPDGVFTIGRERDNSLVLDSNQISRRHARLVQVPEGWVIEDLGSANGTYVNGVRCTSHLMQHGDVIALGSARLGFSIGPALPAVPATAPYARPPLPDAPPPLLSPDTLPIAPLPQPPPLPPLPPRPGQAAGHAWLGWVIGGCGLLLLAVIAAGLLLWPLLRQRLTQVGGTDLPTREAARQQPFLQG